MSTNQLRQAVAGGGTAVAKANTFPGMLEMLKKQVALALPKHMDPDRMARIALTEFRKNKQLAECKPETIFASVIMASQLGLEPGLNGQGYLIPYKGTCTFVPGWKGLVDLAQRSGRSSVWTGAVFDGDELSYEKGTAPYIKHIEHGESDPKKLTHVYAVGRVRGAEFPIIEVWPIARVWKHRDRFNKVGGSHYSFQHPEMYARKVVLLQVLKYMPQSIELATALDLENAAEAGKQKLDLSDAIDGTFTAAQDEAGEESGAGQQTDPPIDEPKAIELFREAKTDGDIDAIWQRIVASYGGQGVPLPIEAARNTYRDIVKQKAGAK